MIDLRTIFSDMELRGPATEEMCCAAERQLGAALPEQLRAFYKQSDGVCGRHTVTLFEVEGLLERNLTYETFEYLPKMIYIGNDNGECGIFISKWNEELAVSACNLGDQFEESLVEVAPSLSHWFAARCPWPYGGFGVPQ
jgi:hypothetical protein